MKFSFKNSITHLAFVSSLWITLLCPTPNTCHAFSLSGLGGLTVSNLSQATPTATSSSSNSSYGLGALIDWELVSLINLEGGLFYMQHNISLTGITGSGLNGTISYNNLSLPLMVKFRPFPYLAIEGGAYIGLSSNSSTTAIGGTASQGVSSNADSGLIGGVSVMLPLVPGLYARGSIFYEHGLTNLVNNASPSVNARNVDILIGVLIGV